MRKLTLFIALVLLSLTGFSQYYYLPQFHVYQNPNGLNTDVENPAGYIPEDWISILGPAVSTPTWSAVQDIPFSFDFNGNAVTQYIVSSTGVLTFTTGATDVPSTTNVSIPNSEIPDNSVCVWGLNGNGANDNVVIKTFGDAPNRQHWVFFSSYSIPGQTDSWSYWSIVFEETTNKIYIVDQRTADAVMCGLTLGIQIDGSTAIEVAGSPNIDNASQLSSSTEDNVYYEFIFGTQPLYDVSAYEITNDDFLPVASAPYTIEGLIENFGTETITSFDINYQIDDDAAVTASVSGVSIEMLATYNFTHETAWNATVDGYVVKAWVSNINGNDDLNTYNDICEKSIAVVGDGVQKMPLYEIFTSSTCAPCVSGNETLASVLANYPDMFTCVKYQMSWPVPGDPYYTEEGGERRMYYGVNAVPDMWINGGFNENTNNFNAGMFDQNYDQEAYLDITSDYEVNGQTISINVSVESNTNLPFENLRLLVAVIENETTGNVGSNGETEFLWVMMKMVPDAQGELLAPMESGVAQEFSYTVDLSSTNVEEYDDLSIVTFVQKEDSKLVLQSTLRTTDPVVTPTVEFSPVDGASDIELDAPVTLTFSEAVRLINDDPITDPASLITLKKDDASGDDVAFTATINSGSTEITVTPDADFDVEQTYYVAIEATVEGNTDIAIEASNASFTTLSNVGINSIENVANVKVYPNPAADITNVSCNLANSENVNIDIFNIIGEKVYSEKIGNLNKGEQNFSINTSNLKTGIYTYRIQIGDSVVSGKLSIMK